MFARYFRLMLIVAAGCRVEFGGRLALPTRSRLGRACSMASTLGEWKKTAFGGEGDVVVEDGQILIDAGNPMSGITWKGKCPKMNYELSLEAQRVSGSDFFCGLTFPVGDDPCSFICGGWGGGVVGLSSLDGNDASENETTKYQEFESQALVQNPRAA